MGPSPTETSITLHTQRFSPYALRAHIAVLEKGIPFNAVMENLRDKTKGLLEANPIHRTVPSLVHDGNAILESLIILEYLDEAFPDTVQLLPKDPVARAKCRFWADYMYKSEAVLVPGLMAGPTSPQKAAAVETYVNYIRTMESAMAEFSEEGPYFCGKEFGYLDVVLAPWLSWAPYFETVGFHVPDNVPRRQKLMKAISEHKSVKDTLPTVEEIQEYMAFIFGNPRK